MNFDTFRQANVARCVKWHPRGINSWSASDWLTAITGELGELASLIKMRNRERDGLVGNKFSPTNKQIANEIADVLTYLDLLAASLEIDLGRAAMQKFNEISERNGFPDRIVEPEFCCIHSWQDAKAAAWAKVHQVHCGCDHNESCIKCFPAEFRTGGKFSEYRATPAAQSQGSEPPSMPEQFPQVR